MVSQLWIRKNCSMFKILILFCCVLTVKLLTSRRRMARFEDFYKRLMEKQGERPDLHAFMHFNVHVCMFTNCSRNHNEIARD